MEPLRRGKEARYLTALDIQKLEPPKWLLDGFLIEGGLTILFGPPKTGKSMLTLDWCLNIGRGSPWYNRHTTRGTVLYVAGEGLLGLGTRIEAWKREHGEPDNNTVVFRDPIVDLLGVGGPEAMLREMALLKMRPKLIVIDTLAKAMVGGDENSAEDMGRAVDGADRIRHATGAAVLLLHHTTKASDRTMRGSSALLGAADVVLGLTKQKDGAITLRVDAARDFESGASVDLRMVRSARSAILIPATDYELTQLTDEQVHALVTLAGCVPVGEQATREAWRDASGLNEATFKRMVASLEKFVEREGGVGGKPAYFAVNEAGYDMIARSHDPKDDDDLTGEWEDPWDDYTPDPEP